jgi:PKD repeat protein
MNRVQNFTVFLPDATSYTKWDFGDGKGEIKNTDVSSNEQTQSYAYTKSGTYIITVRSYDASDILLKEERFEKRVLPCLIPVNPNIHIWKE